MAEVWRAKTFGAGGFERLVAIKRILPNIAEDEEFITMFIDEAKITVQLNHANIAQIYELSSIASSYFIAMEYVSGKDMRAVFDRCRKRGEPAPIPLSCYLIAQCCEGLDYAHRANDKTGRPMGIVHRDVSPQNALISYEGEVKVIDFGIAKAAGKATKTQAGILKGKFGYMSPEQIRGLPLDRRSDVFAIGVCLYEMLTGERLFVGDSDFSVLEKVRKVEVLPPSHFNRKIPDALEKIVMKSLAKDVDERYGYASELAEDLRKFLYTSGYSFGRKDLAAFMKATFAEDVDKEKTRLQEYAEIKPPEGMLAAAEMGFGMGQVPAPSAVPVNASAVTALPTMAPPSVAPSQMALPPIVRPPPPTLAPTPSAPRPANLPRLTAQQAVHTVGKEEHEATVLADGASDDTNPGQLNVRNREPDPATDPGRPAMQRGMVPHMGGADAMTQGVGAPPVLRPGADGLPPNARRPPPGGLPPRMAPPMMVENSSSSSTSLGAYEPTGDTSPQLAAYTASSTGTSAQLQPVEGGGNKTVIAILAVGAVLVATLIGLAVVFRPAPRGLLLIEVPGGASGQVRVSVDGKDLTEADGRPITDWPQVREVPAGKHTVMVKVPGYDTLTEIVDVKEGNEPTSLKNSPKKKSGE
ncbi:MAG: protein kinase [Myxococcaceae bacterium]|nr:protein kinase [Myxococcaceae bacterium]